MSVDAELNCLEIRDFRTKIRREAAKIVPSLGPQLGEKCQKQLKISTVDLPRQHAATMHHGPVVCGWTAAGYARTDCLQCGRSSLVIGDRAHDADMQSMTIGVLMLLMLTLMLTLLTDNDH